jgi:Fe-Mn family superoxide dismutase
MELHHKKHHQTYITNLNAAEETISSLTSSPQNTSTIKQLIALQPAVKFNGGGHVNHSLFWKNLAPAGSEESQVVKGGKFEQLVERDFGGLEGLKKDLNAKTAAIQGSGWGWVVRTVVLSTVCLLY